MDGLFGNISETETQTGFDFPAPLTDKYRPKLIADFVGLEKVKRILARFTASPDLTHFRFVGSSGTGKTSMGFALAAELKAELHHVRSQDCNLARFETICRTCNYVPMSGKRLHLVLVDEADCMSDAAQKFLLSKIDGTDPCPNTIWVFTCNAEDRLEDRFLSRSMRLEFSTYGMAAQATELLNAVWTKEVGPGVPAPNLARIVKDSNNNVREALTRLKSEILAA